MSLAPPFLFLFVPHSVSTTLNCTALTLLLNTLLSMLNHAALRPLVTGERLAVSAEPALVRDGQPLDEGLGGPPMLRLVRHFHLGIHLVDLFQSETLGLVDEEVHEGDTQEAAPEPDEKDLGLQVCVARAIVHEVGGAEGDCPV